MQFKHACEEMYQEMLSEVYESRCLHLPPSSRIAHCFKVSLEYWNKMSQQVKNRPFTDQQEEIWFFKFMKPKYTALIEYYTLVYHAELFMPSLKDEEVHDFWKKENEKIKKFYRQHSSFCDYYKSGSTCMDHIYFIRSEVDAANRIYDTDAGMMASHGHLATSLLAYDMYSTYVTQQTTRVNC